MNLKIRRVIDNGTLASERVVFDVLGSTSLELFILTDNTYVGDKISNEWRHSYWFPSKDVSRGDEVVLYTKNGTNKTENLLNGAKRHIFYWNLGNCVWNNNGDAAVLFNLNDWETHKVN